MSFIKRFQIIQVHMLLASFLMPIAIIYFISGALYTLDFKGHINKKIISISLEQAFTPNLEALADITTQALDKNNLVIPGGEPELKKRKGKYELRWGDLQHAIRLRPTSNPLLVDLTYRDRNFLAQIMRIHRADAGIVFKVFTMIMVTGLIFIFATGSYMALSAPGFRRPALLSMSAGLLSFILLLII